MRPAEVVGMTGSPIVVGVDGSRAAQLALRWALCEAHVHSCTVRAVHAWSLGSVRDFVWTSRRALLTESRALLATAVAAARRHTDSRVEASCHTVEGAAGAALVTAATDAALLVLGVRGGRRAFGSIGAHCARHAAVPLVIISSTVSIQADRPAPRARATGF